jgi:4-amino-4-deoxy-L-arabinose transferase-like glycosyltransferase
VALFAIATDYMAWLIGRRLAGERAGLLAAVCLAVLPMHVVHSHFCTVDVPATFWVSVALYNALRWPAGKRAALWCGLAAGLAAGTKYNSGLVLLAGWTAVWLARDVPRPARWRAVAVMTGATAIAFFCATPGVLLDMPGFLRDFGYEVNHVQTGHGLVFVGTGPGWWYHLAHNMWQGVGAFLPVAALLAVAVLAFRRKGALRWGDTRQWPVLLAFAVPYFALISLAAVRFQRYDLPLLPLLAVGAGALFARLRGRWRILTVTALAGTLVLAQGEVSTMTMPRGDILLTLTRYQADPRDAVAAWFAEKVRRPATIGLSTAPWFYTPPFSVANAGPQSRPLYESTAADRRYTLVTPDADDGTAFAEWPEFVVLSDYEYGDALRLAGIPVPERAADIRLAPLRADMLPEADRMARLWNNVVGRYAVLGVWSPAHHAFGLRWSKRRLPPHDAFYPYPTLIVFRRTD